MKRICLMLASVCLTAFAERIELKTDATSCVIETAGARVLSFVAPDGREVLWNANPVQLEAPKWAHGGIPICWPWFSVDGRGDVHGTAWRRPFAVVAREAGRDRAKLVLAREEGDIRLEYAIALGEALKLELKTINRGKADFSFTTGFHPYFRVGERDRTSVEGLESAPIPMTRTIDDVWPAKDGPWSVYRLHDPSFGRTIVIFSENASDVNVWNPGPEKDCPGLIPGDEWRRFVCVEPIMRGAGKSRIALKPGEIRTLTLGIGISRLKRVKE